MGGTVHRLTLARAFDPRRRTCNPCAHRARRLETRKTRRNVEDLREGWASGGESRCVGALACKVGPCGA